MGARPSLHLHVAGDTPLHRLPGHVKLVALLGFVLAVVTVPPSRPLALLALAGLALGILLSTRVPWRHLAPRLLVEAPFLVFALVLPFVATGPRATYGPFTVSVPGLQAGVALILKATAGVLVAVAFAVTTRSADLVRGLHRLRVPAPLVLIVSFMVRYLGVVLDELARMQVARESRGFRARSLRAWPVLAASAGALFIRSYERGERVHLAMLSRGFTGALTLEPGGAARPGVWAAALAPAAVALAVSVGVRLA